MRKIGYPSYFSLGLFNDDPWKPHRDFPEIQSHENCRGGYWAAIGNGKVVVVVCPAAC